jgi:hypothetical protein
LHRAPYAGSSQASSLEPGCGRGILDANQTSTIRQILPGGDDDTGQACSKSSNSYQYWPHKLLVNVNNLSAYRQLIDKERVLYPLLEI